MELGNEIGASETIDSRLIEENERTGNKYDPYRRVKLIGEVAKRLYDNGKYGIVRQMGDFSSFSVPSVSLDNSIWQKRDGFIKMSRSYHEAQLDEVSYLKKHLFKAIGNNNILEKGKSKLILTPTLKLNGRGNDATISRLTTLREFLIVNYELVDFISSETAKNISMLIIGDWFVMDSTAKGEKSFTHTFFSLDENMVRQYIHKFDFEFNRLLSEKELTIEEAKNATLAEIEENIVFLKQQNSRITINDFVTQNEEESLVELFDEITKYIQYDSKLICIDDDTFQRLPELFISFLKERSNLSRKDLIQKIDGIFNKHLNLNKKSIRGILTNHQYNNLQEYLANVNYYCEDNISIEELANMDAVVSFSFGRGKKVNRLISNIIEKIIERTSRIKIIVQFEIADILFDKTAGFQKNEAKSKLFKKRKTRLEVYEKGEVIIYKIGPKNGYFDSLDLVKESLQFLTPNEDVGLVSQSWHAPRCFDFFQNSGIKVEKGRFVNEFSDDNNDQGWVKDVLSWLIKESTR